jgi:hypothetical protein
LYERVLPYLTSMPVLSALQLRFIYCSLFLCQVHFVLNQLYSTSFYSFTLSYCFCSSALGNSINDFRLVPLGGDRTFINTAVECLRYIGRESGLDAKQADHLPMVVNAGMIQIVQVRSIQLFY